MYSGSSTPLTPLGQEFLTALNTVLSGAPLLSSLFQSIVMSNIMIGDSNTTIEVTIPNFIGTTSSPTSPDVSGTALISITISGTDGIETIDPNAISGLTQTTIEVEDIVTATNLLNGYTANNTSNQTALSRSMIMAMGTITSTSSENFTFGDIFISVFNGVTATDVQTVNATT